MKYLMLVIMGCLSIGVQAQAASFDCRKAGTKVAHIICDNPDISKLDEEVAVAYKAALQRGTKAKSIVHQQKEWLKQLSGCAEEDCVKSAYVLRIDELAVNHVPGRVLTIISKDNKLCDAYKQYIEQEYRASQSQEEGDQYFRTAGPDVTWGWRDGPPQCMRPFGEQYPEFSPVKWQEINAADYPEFAGQAYRYINDWPWARTLKVWQELSQSAHGRAGAQPLTSAWFNEAAEEMKNQYLDHWLFFFRAEADIDNDGHPETLLKVDKRRCGWDPRQITGEDKGPDWEVPIIVVDDSGKKIDTTKSEWILGTTLMPQWEKTDFKGSHGLGLQSFDVFGFGGKIYFDRWEEEWPYNYRLESTEKVLEGYAALTVYSIARGVTSPVCRFKVNKF